MLSIVILIILLALLSWLVISSIQAGITPMPSSPKALQAIGTLIPEHFEGKVVDLGSGWGDLALFLAKKFPESTVTGYEMSYVPYLVSKMRAKSNLNFFYSDFFNKNLKPFNVVVCYLYPAGMERLKLKLEKELLNGTLVISNTFAVPGWTPIQIVELTDLYRTKIYLYRR